MWVGNGNKERKRVCWPVGQMYMPGWMVERGRSLLARPLMSHACTQPEGPTEPPIQWFSDSALRKSRAPLCAPRWPEGEDPTFPLQLQPEELCIFFSLFWWRYKFLPTKWFQFQRHENHFRLYLGNPEVPKKRWQGEARLVFSSLFPCIQRFFEPSDTQTEQSPVLLWEWLQWPRHSPIRHHYDIELKSKENQMRTHIIPNIYWEVAAICPPEFFIMVQAQTSFGVLDKSLHFSGLCFLKSSLLSVLSVHWRERGVSGWIPQVTII